VEEARLGGGIQGVLREEEPERDEAVQPGIFHAVDHPVPARLQRSQQAEGERVWPPRPNGVVGANRREPLRPLGYAGVGEFVQ
jgi:hypothetical protein